MSPIPPVWKEQRAISWLDVDVLGRLRPQTLFAYLLDAASNHAQGTAYGYYELAARNLKWVMMKLQVVIRQQPRFGDELTVETWGKGTNRLYALRDFALSRASGEKMVSGTAAWLLIDQRRGLPHRWDERSEYWPWNPDREELETNIQRVPEVRDGQQVGTYRVHFSDIDVNQHVNATRYLQWIVDSHTQEHLETSELASFDISFIAEALPRDEVTVVSETRGASELCAVRRVGDDKELCRAELRWRTG